MSVSAKVDAFARLLAPRLETSEDVAQVAEDAAAVGASPQTVDALDALGAQIAEIEDDG